MAVPGSFGLRLNRLARGYLEEGEKSAERFTDEIVAEAKRIAPVDTGEYRADIQKRRDFSLVGTALSLVGVGQGSWNWSVISTKPYAERLELGWSKQAPRGVFGIASATVRARRRGFL